MNVTFHTVIGLATAAALSSRQKEKDSSRFFASSDLPVLAAGFAIGILTHGILDIIPHAYPIKSAVDVAFSLALFCVTLLFVRRRHWLLLGVCFVGSLFPDLVDLGPAILNKRLGTSLPVVKIFPWHWRQYSGSIYDGSRRVESLLYHLLVVGVGLGFLYGYRRHLFRGTRRSLFRGRT